MAGATIWNRVALVAWNLYRISALLAQFLLLTVTFLLRITATLRVCTYDFAELRCRILACLYGLLMITVIHGDRRWWD